MSEFPSRLSGDPHPSTNASDAAQFLRSDYEGWGSPTAAGPVTHPRIKWIDDPAGSGLKVMQMIVEGTDDADQWGGCRCTIGSDKQSDQKEGNAGWASMAVWLPQDFQYPDTWFLLWQNFSTSGNPAQAIELRAKSGNTRNYFYWKNQYGPSSSKNYFELGPADLGVWHYFAWYIEFTVRASGTTQVWYKRGSMPDPTNEAPKVDVHGINTLYSGGEAGSKVWLALYRDPSKNQRQVVNYRGYRRSANLGTVLAMP